MAMMQVRDTKQEPNENPHTRNRTNRKDDDDASKSTRTPEQNEDITKFYIRESWAK